MPGDIDLVLKRSEDGGVSWSPLQVVGDNGPNTFGNPCPVVDRTTGTIWLLTTQNRGTDREKDIIAGTSQAGRSVGGVAQHGRRRDLVGAGGHHRQREAGGLDVVRHRPGRRDPDQKRPPGDPGQSRRLRARRVHHSHVVFSDDGGRSWQIGGSADAGTNESQVVELADGRLMLNMRNHPPKAENFRMVATSDDGGRTWSQAKPDRALIEPPAQASLLRWTTAAAGGRNRLLFSNPASARRERMTVRSERRRGRDAGRSSRVVHEGPAAYSSLVVLPDRSIGLLFERGDRSPYEKITFVRLTLEWLTEGRDRGPSLAIARASSGIYNPTHLRLERGTRLGPYEVISPIGSGGMGEVWEGRDSRLDRRVAIKVSREQFSDRFDREARAVAALNHPHICTLHDVGPDYLVMDLAAGGPAQVISAVGQ